MKASIDRFWNKISRIGLREGEDVMQFREVILMNRIIVVMQGVILFYIPFEIYFNGIALIPAVLLLIILTSFSLVFHYFRLFRLSRYYLFLTGTAFVIIMGLLVGKGVGNNVTLIPVVLLAIIMFRTNAERIAAFLLTVALYFLQHYLFDVIKPTFIVKTETMEVFAMLFFIMALLMTFIAGFYFIRTNREYENIIIDQKEKMESKNKEITDSINYAKRIQAAILPAGSLVKNYLPDSFIYYQPKDIVAGDFYWLEKKNDLIIFAAADCTGHGVPGAMVSVICNNALNRCVREFGLTDPAKILDQTREIIITEFEKSDDDVKDGMDISLCCYNPDTKELSWAGANNSLVIINENGLTEIKPDKQPIGKYMDPKPYTAHRVQLKKNDLVYVFTDGYQDQFGGDKGKKFKASRLKELLLNIREKTIPEQKIIIENTFNQWKGGLEQIDDVCIIGVKI
jgi:serine phosphatase RsbU (regulator of sigma subunit)